MGNIIPLHGDPHETTQRLLPWYVTGTLEPAERALVEEHVAHCVECEAELLSEERLRAQVVDLPPMVTGQWEALRARALASPRPRAPGWWASIPAGGRIALVAAGQAGIMLLGIGAYDRLRQPDNADYHALSAPAVEARPGNIIVIFRPDAREDALRRTLNDVGARLVDGPTAAGAYVLAVPQGRRDAALKGLRTHADIVLAQPIDGEPTQ